MKERNYYLVFAMIHYYALQTLNMNKNIENKRKQTRTNLMLAFAM